MSGFILTNIGFFPGIVGLMICGLMCRVRYYQARYAKCCAWGAFSVLFGALMLTSLVSPRF